MRCANSTYFFGFYDNLVSVKISFNYDFPLLYDIKNEFKFN